MNFHSVNDKTKIKFQTERIKKPSVFFLKINYGLIRYLVIPMSEMLQQALNNVGIICMSGIISETLNMTRRYFMLKRTSKLRSG